MPMSANEVCVVLTKYISLVLNRSTVHKYGKGPTSYPKSQFSVLYTRIFVVQFNSSICFGLKIFL